ncbi:MAG: energy transducer TonB [Candidatus Melainabacteria bacterium]|nr:energy transducer TonB [Candidatus Melainabacteria bacterium]
MIGISKTRMGSLLLSFTLALVPLSRAYSFELSTSDMAAYRSDVIRRVFDAVKNNSEYKRTIIDLNINSMGKITSCRVVKSSGNLDLDSKMMRALSQVSLQPVKFASSNTDSMQIQICFANAIPDPETLNIGENEAFTYRGLGAIRHFAGPPSAPPATRSQIAPRERSVTRIANRGRWQSEPQQPVPLEEYTTDDKTYDDEISKLLSDSHAELTFHTVRYGLTDAPQSSVLVEQGAALTEKGRYLQAAQSYIIALIEPIKDGKLESVKPITDKLIKISPKLSGDERLNVAISLLNFCQRVKSLLPFHASDELTQALYSVIPIAQQFAEDSHTNKLGRLARYYRLRGDTFKTMREQDKAKVAYQKYLSINLENDDAQPAEVEQAFEKTLEALESTDDQAAIREVETQRQVWLNKHQDPTNLRAITSACRRLESNLSRFPSVSTASPEGDGEIEQILKLLRTSTLYTQPVPERFFPPGEFLDGRTSPNQSEDVNRCMQKLVQLNDRLFLLSRRTMPDNLVEQLLKATYRFAVRTHNTLQTQSFQRLAEYLLQAGKAQEALVLCDLVGTNFDTEQNTLRFRYSTSNSVEQLRIKSLQALGRTAEADKMLAEIKSDKEKKAQLSAQRNAEATLRRLEKSPPYSAERIQARCAVITNLLNLNTTESLQKAKSSFLENVGEVSSEKFTAYYMNVYWDLSNQLTAIISSATEPDLDFATKGFQSLLELQYKKSSKVFQSPGSIERALPLASTLENSTFAKRPKIYLALIRNLTQYCREQKAPDDTNMLILLRKLAELQTKVGENDNAAKTNVEIVALLDKRKGSDQTELVRQLIALATAEAAADKMSMARKYQQRAADLNFATADPVTTNLSIINLANQYARKGAVKDAHITLLQAAKRHLDSSTNTQEHGVSTGELVRACEKQNNFSEAKGFFEDVIDFEQSRDAHSVVVNLYRMDFADLLLREYSSSSGSSQRERLLKHSDEVFQTAADGLIAVQGQNSRNLGAGVQRRAFQLTLSDLKDQGEALLEKYKAAVSNSAAVSIPVDSNVGIPAAP